MYVFVPVVVQVGAVVIFPASQVCVCVVIFDVSVEDTFVLSSLLVVSFVDVVSGLVLSNVVVILRGNT